MVKGFRWVLLTGLLLLSACNYRLDTQTIEADIEADIERQGRRVTLTGVICPDNVAKQAEAYFRCVGELSSGEIFTINVIQQDDDGTIAWEVPSSKTLINLVSLEEEIQQELSRVATQRVAVSCDGAYRVNERGDSFECDVVGLVTAGSERIESVLVKVGPGGDLSWQEVRLPSGSAPSGGQTAPATSGSSSATSAAQPKAAADTLVSANDSANGIEIVPDDASAPAASPSEQADDGGDED